MDAKENGDLPITGYATECGWEQGLTKREHFAAMAMQGLCAVPGRFRVDDMARDAVQCADALLRALSEGGAR